MLLLFDVEITSIYRARVQPDQARPGTLCISLAYSLLPYAGPLDIHLYVHLWWSICVHAVYRRYKAQSSLINLFWLSRCSVCWLGNLFVPSYQSFWDCLHYAIIKSYTRHKPLGGGFHYELFDLVFIFDMISWSNIQH